VRPNTFPYQLLNPLNYRNTKATAVLNNPELASQFGVLCHVSRQTRWDAKEVFFYFNAWVLELDIRKKSSIFPWAFGKETYTRFNSIDLMDSKFGCDVDLGRLRDVQLHLVGHEKSTHKVIKEELKRLIPVLNNEGNFRRLIFVTR
jgi:hypothetical protein